jgi:hypothetical protein
MSKIRVNTSAFPPERLPGGSRTCEVNSLSDRGKPQRRHP